MRFRSPLQRARARFTGEHGLVDLAAVMVGVIVIGVLGGAITAAVFKVIPWAADKAAAQTLNDLAAAQQIAYAKSSEHGDAGRYSTLDELITDRYLPSRASDTVSVAVAADSSCWVGVAKSASGKLFYTDSGEPAHEYTPTAATACPVDLVGMVNPQLAAAWTRSTIDPSLSGGASSYNGGPLLVVEGSSYLYTVPGGGVTWQRTGPWLASPQPSVLASRTSTSAAVLGKRAGNITTLFFTTDGTTWTQRNVPFGGVNRILNISGDTVIAQLTPGTVAPNSGLAVSYNGGLTWTSFDSPVPGSSIARVTSSTDGNTVTVITTTGDSYLSRNSGITWARTHIPGTSAVTGVGAASSDGAHIIVADGSDRFHISHDAGTTWSNTAAATGTPFISEDGTRVVISSPAQGVLVSVDGGTSFTPRNPPATSGYPTVVGISADGRTVIGRTADTLWTAQIG